jgi:hypothetical protein
MTAPLLLLLVACIGFSERPIGGDSSQKLRPGSGDKSHRYSGLDIASLDHPSHHEHLVVDSLVRTAEQNVGLIRKGLSES